jgi:methylamine dehydrogenase accessory protein MauD
VDGVGVSAMTIALVLLWILVLVLAVIVYALARQVGVLYERVAPAGALMVNAALNVGDESPAVAVQTLDGETLTLGGAMTSRPLLLFFLAPDCPICKSLLPVLKSVARQEQGVDIVLASDGEDVDAHRAYVRANDLARFPYVLSELLGRSYGVSKLPYAVLIRSGGAVGSLGIVNSREHLESLFEAEKLGVASIQEFLARDAERGAPSSLFVDAGTRKS